VVCTDSLRGSKDVSVTTARIPLSISSEMGVVIHRSLSIGNKCLKMICEKTHGATKPIQEDPQMNIHLQLLFACLAKVTHQVIFDIMPARTVPVFRLNEDEKYNWRLIWNTESSMARKI